MAFIPTIPQAGDALSTSQGQLLANNAGLDTTFGLDHFTFSNTTANNGFHKQVTNPWLTGDVHRVPLVDSCKLYSMKDSTALGVIQYSLGPVNTVPTPVTSLQSSSTGITLLTTATTNVLDFTGLNRAICEVHTFSGTNQASMNASSIVYSVFWSGAFFRIQSMTPTGSLSVVNSANILQVKNVASPAATINDIYWTLKLLRVS